jgi:hypothetical protein
LEGRVSGIAQELTHQILDLGKDLFARATDFDGYAKAMVNLQDTARSTGQAMGDTRSIIDTMKQSGITAEQAAKQLENFSEFVADLRQGPMSPGSRRLLGDIQDPETQQEMQKYAASVRGATSYAERLNKTLEMRDRILRDAKDPITGASAVREFERRVGIPLANYPAGTRFKEATAEENKLQEDRMQGAREFQKTQQEMATNWERIGTSMAASAMQMLNLNRNMESGSGILGTIATTAERFETTLRNSKDVSQAIVELMGKLIPSAEQAQKNIQAHQEAQQKAGPEGGLDVVWRTMRDAALGTLGLTPPSMAGSFAGGLPFGAYRAYRARHRGEEQAEPPAPQPIEIPLPRPQPERPAPPIPPAPVGEQPAPFAERFAAVPQPEQARPAPQPEQPAPPTPEPGRPPAVAPEAPATFAERFAPAAPSPAPAAAEQHASLLDENNRALKELSDVLNRLTTRQPVDTQMSGLAPGLGADAGVVAQPPKPAPGDEPPKPAPEMIEPPKPIEKQAEAPQKPAENALTPPGQGMVGSPTDSAPVAPVMPAPDPSWIEKLIAPIGHWLSSTSEAMTTPQLETGKQKDARISQLDAWSEATLPEVSSKLDQAASQNVEVSGTGRIAVDVNAPSGTSVTAQAEGFFKSTEITRQTQMMPAEFGPAPATGISAGEGALSTGTV